MRDVIEDVVRLYGSGRPFGLGDVVRTWKSRAAARRRRRWRSSADGEAVGSVSGGCVEGAVYDLAQEVLATGRRCCSATGSPTTTPSPSA